MADEQEVKVEKEIKAVRIAFEPGPVVRTVEEHEWSEAAGWVQEVSVELAANLLAYPHGGFTLAEKPTAAARKALADRLGIPLENLATPGEPLRRHRKLADLIGPERAAQLRELGIGDVRSLAELKSEAVAGLVFRTGATAAEFEVWKQRAADEVAQW